MSELTVSFPETADIETSSEAYAQRFSGAVGAWFLKVQAEATLRMLAPYPRASVLDVGGGHGQLAGALTRHGYRTTVLGSAEVCKARIRRLVDEGRCAFQVGNVLDLPYRNQAFDIVVSYRLLPHVSRWADFLAELTRVARFVVVVDFPTVRSLNYAAPYLFRLKKRVEGNTRPFASFHEAELLETFRSLGFGRGDRYAEFFIPMVIHRALRLPGFSRRLEDFARGLGLTGLFGSPVILSVNREGR